MLLRHKSLVRGGRVLLKFSFHFFVCKISWNTPLTLSDSGLLYFHCFMLFSLLEDCSLGFLLFSFALGLLIFFCANRSRISYYISLHAMQLGVVVFFLFIERDKVIWNSILHLRLSSQFPRIDQRCFGLGLDTHPKAWLQIRAVGWLAGGSLARDQLQLSSIVASKLHWCVTGLPNTVSPRPMPGFGEWHCDKMVICTYSTCAYVRMMDSIHYGYEAAVELFTLARRPYIHIRPST
jgi:hypothetical protein